MSLVYFYTDVMSQRVFRHRAYDHRFIPASLDGVHGMIWPYAEIFESPQAGWSKFKGLYRMETILPENEQKRLLTLNERCEAFETLYRTLYIIRRALQGPLPYDDSLFQLRLAEAEEYLKTKSSEGTCFLRDFAESQNLDLKTSAEMIKFLDQDRLEALRRSELLRMKWEKKFLATEHPARELENFKNTVYLG